MTTQQAWKIAVTESVDHEHYHTLQSGYVAERSMFNWQTKDMTASYSRAVNFQDVNCSVYNHFSLALNSQQKNGGQWEVVMVSSLAK